MRHDEMLGLLPRLLYGDQDSPALRLFGLELLFWALAILLTFLLVHYRPTLIERAEIRLRAVSQYKRFWLATFVLTAMLVRLALLPWIPVPVPVQYDECSYLVASDTFAHGRLTNLANPMWVHFETFNVNMQPTYQSMYPPAQGLALAFGQKLTGVPWAGVLFSTALMCGAIYWMLLGWLPAPWAWLGGAFACVRFGVFSYWTNSYFGGAVAAFGGALVLGAFPRLRNGPRIRPALVLASGLLILANSRPLEGLLFSVPLVFALAIVWIKGIGSGRATWQATARAAFPAIALLAVGAVWMLYYNWRGTGNPLLTPYQVNFQAYHISKPFLFQKPNPIPLYRHLSMRVFYMFHELPALMIIKYDLGYFFRLKAAVYYGFFIWPFLLLIGPCVYAIWRSEVRVVLFAMALLAAGLFAQIWPPHAHYAAPAAGAVILMLLYSARHFRNLPSDYAIWSSRAIAMVLALWMISPIAEILRDPYMIFPNYSTAETGGYATVPIPPQFQRARIQSQLDAQTGKQLIIVRFPSYLGPPSQDWVYNDADIDHAHVIWARDMGYLKNRELLDYYRDRKAWFIDRGDEAGLIVPYELAMAPIKLAFEGPSRETASQRTAASGQALSFTMTKPVLSGRAEPATSHSR